MMLIGCKYDVTNITDICEKLMYSDQTNCHIKLMLTKLENLVYLMRNLI